MPDERPPASRAAPFVEQTLGVGRLGRLDLELFTQPSGQSMSLFVGAAVLCLGQHRVARAGQLAQPCRPHGRHRGDFAYEFRQRGRRESGAKSSRGEQLVQFEATLVHFPGSGPGLLPSTTFNTFSERPVAMVTALRFRRAAA